MQFRSQKSLIAWEKRSAGHIYSMTARQDATGLRGHLTRDEREARGFHRVQC